MHTLHTISPLTEVLGDKHPVSLIHGDLPCYELSPNSISLGIVSNGVSGLDVGNQFIGYALQARSDLHRMIVANRLLTAGVQIDGEKFDCEPGSILVRLSKSTFVWSERQVPAVTWSGNEACKILKTGVRKAGRVFDGYYDSSFHMWAEAVAVLQPGAQLRLSTTTEYKENGHIGLTKEFPYVQYVPRTLKQKVETTTVNFAFETITWSTGD